MTAPTTAPTSNRDKLRQDVAQRIGDCFAMALSGNRMPHISGDPRARLLPHQSRELEDCAASAADAAIAAYEAHRPRADVVLTREEWREAIATAKNTWFTSYQPGPQVIATAIRVAFPWIKVEGE